MNEQITLRELNLNDINSVFEITSDSNSAKFMRFDTHTNISEAKDLVEKYIIPPNLAYAITEKEQGFIGYISMTYSGENEYSLSTMLSPTVWNKGYSTQVLARLLEICKINNSKINNVKKLSAYVVDKNIASCKVLEKNRFYIAEVKTFPNFDGKLNVYTYEFE